MSDATEIIGPFSCWHISQRLRLHYVDWGNGEAAPVILVHGGRDHARSWDWVARHLRSRFHVVAPDLRGHGDSAWAIGSNYPIYEFVYDLAQLVDVVAPDGPVVLIGHSFGGVISTQYAAVFPDRVKALVNIEGFGPPPELVSLWRDTPMPDQMARWVVQMRRLASRSPRHYPTLDEAAERMQQENPSLSEERARHLTIHGAARNEDGTYSWKFDNYFRSMPPREWKSDGLLENFQRIPCPTLLVRGADSWAEDLEADGRAKALAQGRTVEIPGAGHFVQHDQFDALMEAVDGFLDDVVA